MLSSRRPGPAGLLLTLALLAGCGNPPAPPEIRPQAGEIPETPEKIVIDERDWPWWRGPTRDAKAAGPAPPLAWSQSENIVWSAEVPGRGHASPIVWRDRVFVHTADEASQAQLLLCYSRESGDLLWQRELHRGGFMTKHQKNSHASATPATDGERVFTPYIASGALWLAAVDFDGKLLWHKESGKFRSQHGYGASPVIYGPLVIVAGDNVGPGSVAAHDRRIGEIVWRTARSSQPSYGTPVAAHTGGRDRLLLSGQGDMASYDPRTGERDWLVRGPADVTANTVAWNERLVFASGGYPERVFMALDAADGREAWREDLHQYVVSPLEHEGRLYVVQDSGVMRCLESETGREVWRQRLGGNFSASPALWGDRLYVPSEKGGTFVVRAADEFELLGENDLGEGAFATPVICDGDIFLRTETRLWRIGSP